MFTLRIAAAQPPSAITVWALPNSDLVTTATRRPRSRASMTARNPAPPAPITTTSYWCRSSSTMKPHLPFRIDVAAEDNFCQPMIVRSVMPRATNMM